MLTHDEQTILKLINARVLKATSMAAFLRAIGEYERYCIGIVERHIDEVPTSQLPGLLHLADACLPEPPTNIVELECYESHACPFPDNGDDATEEPPHPKDPSETTLEGLLHFRFTTRR